VLNHGNSMRSIATPWLTLGLTLFVSTASAQDADSLQGRPAMPVHSGLHDSLPSPTFARDLSLACTLVPVAAALLDVPGGETAAAAGAFIGPAVGYFYGGCTGRGVQGILIRGGIAVVGVAVAVGGAAYGGFEETPDDYPYAIAGVGILFAASAIYDIAVVGRHVQKRNVEHRLSFEPTMRVASDGSLMTGITLRH
jgi:hypothetical protein